MVTGGRAADVAAFDREMMRCWPGARIVLDALAGRKRRMFEQRVDGLMRGLGEDAFRYHHPYLLASRDQGRGRELRTSSTTRALVPRHRCPRR